MKGTDLRDLNNRDILIRIATKLDDLIEKSNDHESRLRGAEEEILTIKTTAETLAQSAGQRKTQQLGIAAIVAAVFSTIATMVYHAITGK